MNFPPPDPFEPHVVYIGTYLPWSVVQPVSTGMEYVSNFRTFSEATQCWAAKDAQNRRQDFRMALPHGPSRY